MRIALALFLLLTPLVAAEEQDLAARFPKGATFYVESRGLAAKVDAVLASELGKALRGHPAVQHFLESPEGMQLRFGEAMVQGATGHDFLGILRALGGREAALAVYGAPPKVVAMARVDPAAAAKLVAGAELLLQKPRETITPADASGPALWKLGPAHVVLDGDLLAVSPDLLLATSVRERSGGLASSGTLAEARRLAGADADLFAFVDLTTYGAEMRKGGKPKDLGQALLLGALGPYVPRAPWAAVRADVQVEGDAVRLAARSLIPAPEAPSEAVQEAFGGTLDPLPFALPERTIAVARMRRSLSAAWTNREDLIAEKGIPGLVEFETNFGNLTGGMNFVEQFLPTLRDADMVFVATRRVWGPDERAPAVRIPQGAFLLPVKESEDFATKMQIAFQTGIGIVNATQGMMGNAFLMRNETYKGVPIQSARYLPPSAGELEAAQGLPIRYNFEPSVAIVNGYFVLASTPGIVRELIDAQGAATPVAPGVNAGIWVRGAEALAALRENREALVAQTMMEKGAARPAAEGEIDALLDLSRYVRSLALTAEESRASLGVLLEVVLGPGGE